MRDGLAAGDGDGVARAGARGQEEENMFAEKRLTIPA
jgi:hypothetical protein